jgi:spore coat polysaccharide biosynthesis predicted glycosyltransferase SpsG
MTESFRLADIHICPTPDARSAPSAVKIFNGLKYLIIQPSIEKVQAKEIKPGFNSIAVSAGGSDPSNTLLRLYEIFKDPIFSSFRITFYLGIDFLHKDKIPTHYAKNIFFQPFNHNEIIEQDVLVSAFGVSIYEFLYLGMPIISFGHKPRNAYVSDSLANDTAAILSLGESCTITLERLYSAVQLLSDYSTRKHFNSKGRNLLDLKGASRVVEIVENCLSASF